MKIKLLPVIFLVIIFFVGCETVEKEKYTGDRLMELFNSAARGDSTGVSFTVNVFDKKLPPPGKWNLIKVDSLVINTSAAFFAVLLEYPNPVYNRFCVYDSLFNLLLVDKSLNGYLSVKPIENPAVKGFEVTEMFDSKDSIKLKRTNLYILRGNVFELSFRKFTEMRLNRNYLSQTINVLTEKVISTRILSSRNIQLRFYEDTFLYDSEQKSYLSGEDILAKKIYEFIFNYRVDSSKQYIRDELTALRSVGLQVLQDTLSLVNNYKDLFGNFSIFLPGEWLFRKNILYSEFLTKALNTTHFYSIDMSANFYVSRLRKGETSEGYLTTKLDKSIEKNYTIRYVEKRLIEKKVLLYYEFRCKELVFLVIVDINEDAYDRNINNVKKMLDSFTIDC
ncbi:MAG TPA: hypothetical protein PLT92_02390 [Ignavibacteriaceae bacterium]|jgi:hypothetical protein|nr:hypothetical protein [Ignavibacteriaceae bacterium]HOJ17394.1 hypothetical protein [Ignavibacteriaceae bacterium]HPO56400.1 hypothetical protein [Ignavibacteriaceae bacterium]